MSFVQRSHTSGELRRDHAGLQVTLNGWAHRVRDLGGVMFVDLRDRTGLVQVMLDPAKFPNRSDIRNECCLCLVGIVQERAEGTKNPNMPTGDIEVIAESYTIVGAAKPLPFPVSDESAMQSVNEELRVKHRYLDLRRPSMFRRLAIRHATMRRMRAYLDAQGFLEVETPVLTRSTPEGARDYLVPYRNQPGSWYALPQSPQQYKQLLMVAGIERYYQFAKCFRDEATRADRQPEFMQLDLEMSFVRQDDVMGLAEAATISAVNAVIEEFDLAKDPIGSFERLTYDEAMNLYGCDKPDLRFGLQLFDLSKVVENSGFSVFRNTVEAGGSIRGVRFPGGAKLSRAEVGKLEEFAKEFGAKGLASIAVLAAADAPDAAYTSPDGLAVKSSIVKFFGPEELQAILDTSKAEAGDLLCMVADTVDTCNSVLYRLRLEIGDRLGLRDSRVLKYAWVTDFPVVEWSPDAGRWSSMHHPFTMPNEEDMQYIDSDPGRIRAQAYDLVCNGYETAGGSIRIHDSEIQQRMFGLLGIDAETQKERFGHLIEAFSFGAPPHGGIAWGFDRTVMLLTDTENIREVIPFPKVGEGTDPMMGAPSSVDAQQWAELGLRLS